MRARIAWSSARVKYYRRGSEYTYAARPVRSPSVDYVGRHVDGDANGVTSGLRECANTVRSARQHFVDFGCNMTHPAR